MATAREWVAGARPRTLFIAVAPVLAGTGVAAYVARPDWPRAVLALAVALALQVGANYANDYSDGVRGSDAVRVGPMRLVGSGAAPPRQVLAAALACFAVAGVLGLVLAALAPGASAWLVLVGAACVLAAWGYTGGRRPYGYRALGELAVLVFFGLVPVVGTAYVQTGRLVWPGWVAGAALGCLACALLVANNLRDIPSDARVGKRTLAVVLGDPRTRALYAVLVTVPFVLALVLAAGLRSAWPLGALLAVPLAVVPLRPVLGGRLGRELIPALQATSMLTLGYAALLAAGLAAAGG